MDDNSSDAKLTEQLRKLQEKYAVMGQDLSSYLDGLLYSDYLTYWDYIHLDTLLSLQNPRTRFPDEEVFIMYHQITELYFKLILLELEQIAFKTDLNENFFLERVDRVIRYFRHLISSFDIMVDGLEQSQFLKFRMALLPSSGFQSAQYRLIEIACTDMINLVSMEDREALRSEKDLKMLLDKMYWRQGATELASGKKTLTLQQFENKYMPVFYDAGKKYEQRNLRRLLNELFLETTERSKIVNQLRTLDSLVNVQWRLVHLKSAGKYLHKDPKDIQATGGTNWQKYLPPRFQRIMFFPELWDDREKVEWGRAAVEKAGLDT